MTKVTGCTYTNFLLHLKKN